MDLKAQRGLSRDRSFNAVHDSQPTPAYNAPFKDTTSVETTAVGSPAWANKYARNIRGIIGANTKSGNLSPNPCPYRPMRTTVTGKTTPKAAQARMYFFFELLGMSLIVLGSVFYFSAYRCDGEKLYGRFGAAIVNS
jgi:hypothetical protein